MCKIVDLWAMCLAIKRTFLLHFLLSSSCSTLMTNLCKTMMLFTTLILAWQHLLWFTYSHQFWFTVYLVHKQDKLSEKIHCICCLNLEKRWVVKIHNYIIEINLKPILIHMAQIDLQFIQSKSHPYFNDTFSNINQDYYR